MTHLDGVGGGNGDGDLNRDLDGVGPVDGHGDGLRLDDRVGLGHWHGHWVRLGHLHGDLRTREKEKGEHTYVGIFSPRCGEKNAKCATMGECGMRLARRVME